MKEPIHSPCHAGAKNPYLPLSVYIPDGEPKLFGDRVYLYGSKDYFGGEYCSHQYHVYSAPVDHLEAWEDHGPIFASTDECLAEGIQDGVDWSDGLLWAPDVALKDDVYYLYFCLSDGSEGVAESSKPYGPFHHARRITMNGQPIMGIDPSVLRDGNDYYYTWGQGKCHMAKMMDDMATLDPTTYTDALISNQAEAQGFHEGSSLRKIGEWYVIVYASEYTLRYPNHGAAPTCLDYAVSKNIYGPYERRGTIIDNTGVDPQSWNNHGSILKVKNQWYVFYHGSSNNSKYTRRARVERIAVDEVNGYIKKAEMTSSGFSLALNPEEELAAAYGYRVWGGAYFTEKDGTYPLINVKAGAAVAYRYFDFGAPGNWALILKGQYLERGTVTVLVNGKQRTQKALEPGSNDERLLLLEDLGGKADVELVFDADHNHEILILETIRFQRVQTQEAGIC